MKWRKIDMLKATAIMRTREVRRSIRDSSLREFGLRTDSRESRFDAIEFTDGTIVAVESSFGPLSEVTPDPEARLPEWYTGEPG